MKVGYVANSQGNLALLERALLVLVEQHGVDRVVPLDSAAYDVEAVLRSRRARFPTEVPWDDPRFADFVLASVLQGVVSVPPAEVKRNARLEKRVHSADAALEIGGRKVVVLPLGRLLEAEADLVVSAAGTGGLDESESPPVLRPGHLRAEQWEGAPATCAIVEPGEGRALDVVFVTPDGEVLGSTFQVE